MDDDDHIPDVTAFDLADAVTFLRTEAQWRTHVADIANKWSKIKHGWGCGWSGDEEESYTFNRLTVGGYTSSGKWETKQTGEWYITLAWEESYGYHDSKHYREEIPLRFFLADGEQQLAAFVQECAQERFRAEQIHQQKEKEKLAASQEAEYQRYLRLKAVYEPDTTATP